MNTRNPAYNTWRKNLMARIEREYPAEAAVIIARAPWVEGYEDRHYRTEADMVRWLADCARIEIELS